MKFGNGRSLSSGFGIASRLTDEKLWPWLHVGAGLGILLFWEFLMIMRV